MRRDCTEVITQMLKHIPEDRAEFINDLQWNANDASYKAPEETIQWERTMHTLQKHIPQPTQDWEFELLSVYTTKSVEELRAAFE